MSLESINCVNESSRAGAKENTSELSIESWVTELFSSEDEFEVLKRRVLDIVLDSLWISSRGILNETN